MLHLLEIIYEFQLLRANEACLQITLDDEERARLAGLERLLKGEEIDSRRQMPRVPTPLPVQFTLPGGFGSGEIRNISGSGLAVLTAHPSEIGTRSVVRLSEPTFGSEYFFPTRTVWSRTRGLTAMGLAFDGVPTASIAHGSRLTWRRSFPLGGARQTQMIA